MGMITTALPGLPPEAFAKQDPSPDTLFYAQPRFVTHIDDAAIETVTDLYREHFPPGGRILDLMSSWVSHLPAEAAYSAVIGHGLNDKELAANPRLTQRFVQDLNTDPILPLETASIDAATICVGVQYLQDPVAVRHGRVTGGESQPTRPKRTNWRSAARARLGRTDHR